MPILPRESDIYPDDLLERVELGADPDRRWWALYTMSRREKDLMRRLRALGIPFYGPIVSRRVRAPSGRVRVAHIPLFACYVFLHGDPSQRHLAMTTNCISRWMEVPNGAELTRDLRQVARLIESGAPLTPEARLEPGMRVRLRSGALAGIEGVVSKRMNESWLLVAVNFLQQGVSIQIEDFQVERLD
jgi:transcription antitermination factor NusG